MSRFSDYIVYVDEYGDQTLDNIDPEQPYYIQSFCIFDKQHCGAVVSPQIQKLKFQHFGHDAVLLNADDCAKQEGAFAHFSGLNQQQQFSKDLNAIIERCNFVLIACVVDKRKIENSDSVFENVLSFGLDHIYRFLEEREQNKHLSHIIFNKRNEPENQNLQLSFRSLCDKNTAVEQMLPFELQWAAENSRPSVLQLASFVTHAVAEHVIDSEKSNPAFNLLKRKFYCKGGRKNVGQGYEGWGLAFFPN